MNKANNYLSSVALRNFKAIRKTGALRLTPLTVFIGNNGSGKSSVIEGLETLRTFVIEDIDAAMQMWRGIEHVRNKAARRQSLPTAGGEQRSSKPITFRLRGRVAAETAVITCELNETENENVLYVQKEIVAVGRQAVVRDSDNKVHVDGKFDSVLKPPGKSVMSLSLLHALKDYIQQWQFLTLWPQAMGNPVPQTRARGEVSLAKDGSNIAEYLSDIRTRDPAAFEGIVETLRYVLPCATDMQPALTSELERTVYLQMTEGDFEVPGWLLSTGTLRILTLLAVLRHPKPPPLILVEEIENGMDPRTAHLLVEEIQSVVESGRSQVVATTHSPYLLDLLPLSSIVFVERQDGGDPIFTRPADEKAKRDWAKEFGPGQLYTMSRLSRGAGQ
jgi:predicted ATPase